MLKFFAHTKKCYKILCLKQRDQYPCRWIGRSEPVLRPARNNNLISHILCAERVDDLPGLSRGSKVAFAAVPATLLIWLCVWSLKTVLTPVGLIRAVPVNEIHRNEVPCCHFEVFSFFLDPEVLCWPESCIGLFFLPFCPLSCVKNM